MRRSIVTEYSDEEFKQILTGILLSILKENEIFKPPKKEGYGNDMLKIFSRKEVIKVLGISYPTLIKLHKSNVLRGVLIGKTYKYSSKQIESFFKPHGKKEI